MPVMLIYQNKFLSFLIDGHDYEAIENIPQVTV